jgi:hypothetical protein
MLFAFAYALALLLASSSHAVSSTASCPQVPFPPQVPQIVPPICD